LHHCETDLRDCTQRVILLAAVATWLAAAVTAPSAQPASPPPAQGAPAVTVPGFWDPKRRLDRPALLPTVVIRFLTETDYPPFNHAGADGNPAGLNVDLARMICEELKVACTVQARRFDTLLDALAENRGDAVIASIAATPEARRRADFTDPYYRAAARFVARRDSDIQEVLPERLDAKKVGVAAGTAHEAYLRTFFTEADVRPYPSAEATRQALQAGEVDLLFGDGVQLAFWLNGSDSGGCCAFRGGPFIESRYFGEGIGIAVRRGNETLRQALNWALFRLWETGQFTDLWLRYFPVSPF
jgi:polar amino acid transport system substrate-binding protein